MSSGMSREQRSERLTAAFEWPILVASLLVIPTIAIENAGLSSAWTSAATILNWLIWIAFVTEFVVLLAVAPNRRRWLFKHPLELAIIVLTPPFGPAALQSARAFRLLRLLRLVRVAKLGRSLFSLDGIKWVGLIAVLLIEACGVGLVVVEGSNHQPHLTIVDGLWWAATTVTTIGYGDIAPVTTAGRLIAMCIMVIGLGFVAMLTGAIAQHFIVGREAAEQHAEIASTNEILAAVNDVKADVHGLSERLDRIETRFVAPVEKSLDGKPTTAPVRRSRSATQSSATRR